jgi:hypothetical protein
VRYLGLALLDRVGELAGDEQAAVPLALAEEGVAGGCGEFLCGGLHVHHELAYGGHGVLGGLHGGVGYL